MGQVRRALAFYDTCLQLRVIPDSTNPDIGFTVGVRMELPNVAPDQEVSACLGSRREHVFWPARRKGLDRASGWSDAHCVRRFTLLPGESLSWEEEWTVPDVGAGPAQVYYLAQVMYPRHCTKRHYLHRNRRGCYFTKISAQPLALELRSLEQEDGAAQGHEPDET